MNLSFDKMMISESLIILSTILLTIFIERKINIDVNWYLFFGVLFFVFGILARFPDKKTKSRLKVR